MALSSISQRAANLTHAGESWLMDNLTYVFFLTFLTVVYIANAHYSEKKIREIQTLQQEIRQTRFNYMSLKSNLMYKCKQSEIAVMVEPMGLHELSLKPQKIEVKKGGF
jgi:hypothetical protein